MTTTPKIIITLQEFIYKCAHRLYTLQQFNDALDQLTKEQRYEISYRRRQVKVGVHKPFIHPDNPKTVYGATAKDIHRFYKNGATLTDIYLLFNFDTLYTNYQNFYDHVHVNEWLSHALHIIDFKRDRSQVWSKIRSKCIKEHNEYKKNTSG